MKKYRKSNYRNFEIGLTGTLQDEPYCQKHHWTLERKKEAEALCDILLEEMFMARRCSLAIRTAIALYKSGEKIKAIKMWKKERLRRL